MAEARRKPGSHPHQCESGVGKEVIARAIQARQKAC